QVGLLVEAREELGEGGRLEDLRWRSGATAGAEERDVVAHPHDAGVQVVTQGAVDDAAGFEPWNDARGVLLLEMAVQHRAAQIAVDQQRLLAVAREAAREVARDERFAFARDRARHEQGLREVQLRLNLYRAVHAEEGLGPGRL